MNSSCSVGLVFLMFPHQSWLRLIKRSFRMSGSVPEVPFSLTRRQSWEVSLIYDRGFSRPFSSVPSFLLCPLPSLRICPSDTMPRSSGAILSFILPSFPLQNSTLRKENRKNNPITLIATKLTMSGIICTITIVAHRTCCGTWLIKEKIFWNRIWLKSYFVSCSYSAFP